MGSQVGFLGELERMKVGSFRLEVDLIKIFLVI